MGITTGALTFFLVHRVEVKMWAAWFGGVHKPWFLNDQKAGAFALISLFVVSLTAGGFYLTGPWIAFGAWIAMIVVLFRQPGGPGTIFPIVLAFGAVFALIACWPSAFIGKELTNWLRKR